MNIEAIPRSFWHSASFALIAFTIGFLFISYKSGELTVKFNQLEVRTTNTIAMEASLEKQEESIKEQEKIINLKEKEVEELKVILGDRLLELNEVKEELAQLKEENNLVAAEAITSRIEAINMNKDFDLKIKEKQDNLNILQSQQQQKKQVYQQQREIYQQQQQQQSLY